MAATLGKPATSASSADWSSGPTKYDFTRMTPREMQSAIRGLIKSGQMSLLEAGSLTFMASLPTDGSSPASAPTFDQPMDYLTKAKNIIGAYKSTGDQHNAEHWSRLLDKLQSLQGTPSGVNELV